jgi:hypothetical protein
MKEMQTPEKVSIFFPMMRFDSHEEDSPAEKVLERNL